METMNLTGRIQGHMPSRALKTIEKMKKIIDSEIEKGPLGLSPLNTCPYHFKDEEVEVS